LAAVRKTSKTSNMSFVCLLASGPRPPLHPPFTARLPSSLLRRTSVHAAPRPLGSLKGPLLSLVTFLFDYEQNAQKHEKCGLLAQPAKGLSAAFSHFTLVVPREFT
jgi:hypothetical protein